MGINGDTLSCYVRKSAPSLLQKVNEVAGSRSSALRSAMIVTVMLHPSRLDYH